MTAIRKPLPQPCRCNQNHFFGCGSTFVRFALDFTTLVTLIFIDCFSMNNPTPSRARRSSPFSSASSTGATFRGLLDPYRYLTVGRLESNDCNSHTLTVTSPLQAPDCFLLGGIKGKQGVQKWQSWHTVAQRITRYQNTIKRDTNIKNGIFDGTCEEIGSRT